MLMWVNKLFVFESRTAGGGGSSSRSLFSLWGARLITMVIEVFGVVLLSGVWKLDDMVGKILIQFVVLGSELCVQQVLCV